MIKLKQILLATDFSECSEHAAKYACALADKFGAELHVLYVIHNLATEIPDFGMGLAFPGYLEQLPEKIEEMEKAAIGLLTKFIDDDWQQGKQVVIATKHGQPFVEIIRYARVHENDLIVMGTHGRSALPHTLLGSVAEKVVRKAPCPVLTVKLKEHEFVHP